MAEGTSLVGLQGQPPDMMAKISQLLTIRGQQAQVQQEQQTAQQRAAIAKYDWNKHIGDDGTIDVESVAQDPELQGIAGDSYIDLMSHVAQAKQQQLTAKSTLLGLRSEQRKALAEMVGGCAPTRMSPKTTTPAARRSTTPSSSSSRSTARATRCPCSAPTARRFRTRRRGA
jgi:hypothetical protein